MPGPVPVPGIAETGLSARGASLRRLRFRQVVRTEPGPIFYAIKVRAEPLPFALPPRDGAHLKDRFRQALLGPAAFQPPS